MEIRQNDYGFDLNFTITESDGTTAYNLTGADEVRFQVVEADSRRNILDGACVVVDASSGTVKYTVQAGDFPKSGNYIGGIIAVYTGTQNRSSKDIYITVTKALT